TASLQLTSIFSPPRLPQQRLGSRGGEKMRHPTCKTALLSETAFVSSRVRDCLPWRWGCVPAEAWHYLLSVPAVGPPGAGAARLAAMPNTFYLVRFPASVPALARSDPTNGRFLVTG